jgi:hypothetical protein
LGSEVTADERALIMVLAKTALLNHNTPNWAHIAIAAIVRKIDAERAT